MYFNILLVDIKQMSSFLHISLYGAFIEKTKIPNKYCIVALCLQYHILCIIRMVTRSTIFHKTILFFDANPIVSLKIVLNICNCNLFLKIL